LRLNSLNTCNQVFEERINEGTTSTTYNYVWSLPAVETTQSDQYIDELICRFENVGGNFKDYYPIQNRQFSTSRVYDESGVLVEKYRYSPYGSVEFYDPSNTQISESAIGMTTLFTGREFDPESGLYYFRARYWNTSLGRFISRDPAGYVDGYNLYAGYYEVKTTDPMGFAVVILETYRPSLMWGAKKFEVTGHYKEVRDATCPKCKRYDPIAVGGRGKRTWYRLLYIPIHWTWPEVGIPATEEYEIYHLIGNAMKAKCCVRFTWSLTVRSRIRIIIAGPWGYQTKDGDKTICP